MEETRKTSKSEAAQLKTALDKCFASLVKKGFAKNQVAAAGMGIFTGEYVKAVGQEEAGKVLGQLRDHMHLVK